ncbi:MAG: hypothetical protein JWM44_902 [Bacilli bacterium]|nr:hypothetical protein [Bacilli bacterium]
MGKITPDDFTAYQNCIQIKDAYERQITLAALLTRRVLRN